MIKLLERNLLKNYQFTSYVIGSLQQAFAKDFFDDAETESEKEDIKNLINDRYDFIESYSSDYKKEFVWLIQIIFKPIWKPLLKALRDY